MNKISHKRACGKLSNQCSNDIPTELSPDDFNEYFSTVGDNLAQNFYSTVKTPWRNPQCLYDFKFDPLQKEDVVKCLSCLNHSSKLDLFDFDTKLLRIAANIIGESLCYILNLSLITGEIPLDWKTAKVTPVYKGAGPKLDKANYRPISVIGHIAKVMELQMNNLISHAYILDFSIT